MVVATASHNRHFSMGLSRENHKKKTALATSNHITTFFCLLFKLYKRKTKENVMKFVWKTKKCKRMDFKIDSIRTTAYLLVNKPVEPI